MCDETNQLPNVYPANAAGGTWYINSGGSTIRQCAVCGFWYTGYHGCTGYTVTPSAGFPLWPQTAQPERKPHVCPVCAGKGKVNLPLDNGTAGDECPACKGACVLWG